MTSSVQKLHFNHNGAVAVSREASPKRPDARFAQSLIIALCIAIALACVFVAWMAVKESWLIAPIFIRPFPPTRQKKKRPRR
jgi:hypothetical protein